MRQDNRFLGPKLKGTDAEPRRSTRGVSVYESEQWATPPETGTSRKSAATGDPRVDIWLTRHRRWYDEFNNTIAPRMKKYWRMYRNYDDYPSPGPGQDWRDKTIIPGPYKWIENRVPRKVMALFGGREWLTVEAVEQSDEVYEEIARNLIISSFDMIGTDEATSRTFIQRAIDAERYKEITGHVWWKVWWRTEYKFRKTREKGEDGKYGVVKKKEKVYDNVDIDWLPLSQLAVDIWSVQRRWSIEKIRMTKSALLAQNAAYKEATGENLYKNLDMLDMQASPPVVRDETEEPEDTDRFPTQELDNFANTYDGSGEVEIWLCWDNQKKTLTKIANRTIILDEGEAPTPDGLDPYIGVAAVPIPGQTYGDSQLNWGGPLASNQTRLARARMDEIMLSLFQQFIYREGTITSSQLFMRPGGAIGIESSNPDKPVKYDFDIFQRQPVMPEAFNEDNYRQQQAETALAADPLQQGGEATQKSRDVAATEVQQRITQGNTRYQMENLYIEVSCKKPMAMKVWQLLQLNLTEPRAVRVLGGPLPISLEMIQTPIDIRVGGGIYEMTKANRGQDVQELVALAGNPVFGPLMNGPEILKELFRIRDWKNPARFIKEAPVEPPAPSAPPNTPPPNAAAPMAGMGPPAGGGAPPMPAMPGMAPPTGGMGEGALALAPPTGGFSGQF